MRYLLIISIFTNILLSNNIDSNDNKQYKEEQELNTQKVEDKYKVVPKSKKDTFNKSNLKVNGSIRLRYGF